MTIKAINWNKIEDEKDNEVWKALTTNFWLPEKIPVSNDIPSYSTLTDEEKWVTMRVFGGLTLLDTVQSEKGATSLMADARTKHEHAVLTNIDFMESVHAKSYSNIFATLCSSEENEEIFRWTRENPYLKIKQDLILKHYEGNDPYMRKAASVLLESFLFYSGFYIAFYWASRAKLTNTADMIRLILRDEAIHGYYIGYKAQLLFDEMEKEDQIIAERAVYGLMQELYENEIKYAADLYDRIGSGVTEDVRRFVRYNANKALANLGLKPAFTEEATRVSTAIMTSLNPVSDETHDFFSAAGNSYVIAKVEQLSDDDWDL